MDALPTLDPAASHEARLLALSPDLLGAVGAGGTLELHNPAWAITLERPAAELRATRFLDLVHPDDRPAAELVLDRLADGATVPEFVCRLMRPAGEARAILWSGHGSDGCCYLAGKDITDRQRLEDELAERADRLVRLNAELQEFAYVASHDLAEPLRMITSYLELLQRRYGGQLDETADEFIGFAVGGAERMKRLIDDLLTYSRVGSHQMERRPVALREVLEPVIEGLGCAIEDAGARVQVAADLPVVCADPTQLGQLLQNLIANAVKFHRPGSPPTVSVTAAAEDGGVRIAVADDGIGIAPEHQDRIFKMFARLHGREEYEGTGIGLALCRRIAERHGGRLWVESGRDAPRPGSTFHVWLPGPA